MKSKLRASGLFCGLLFFIAALINCLSDIFQDKRSVLAALLDFPNFLSILLVSLAMFGSAFTQKLAWLQPVIFLALVPLPIMQDTTSFFGLGFFTLGVLLLFKLGFYDKHRVFKAIITVAYIIANEVVSVLLSANHNLYNGLMPVFFILTFIVFLFLTFRDQIIIYLKEPKVKISLNEKGLADAEQLYVRAIISGQSVKEVTFEFGVSESTVRNTLARAYKKLGLHTKADLMTLAEKYEIVQ